MLTEQELEEIRPLIHTTNMTISASLDLKKKLWVHVHEQQQEIKKLIKLVRMYRQFKYDQYSILYCPLCSGENNHRESCPRLEFTKTYGE